MKRAEPSIPGQSCPQCLHHFCCHPTRKGGVCDAGGGFGGGHSRPTCDCTVLRETIEVAFHASLPQERPAPTHRTLRSASIMTIKPYRKRGSGGKRRR